VRDVVPRKAIQQQMYARERRGIFRATEGYDTIAKSSGLDPAFIKKTLHPYCVYDAPAELAARGEKDEALYPETIHLLHLENGDTVLGRSVYQAADFTGLRSAFFTHNYVMAGDSGPDDYRDWLNAAFASGYNIEEGAELAELERLPLQASAAVVPSARSVLALLNIGEKPFKQLLYAVMAAISGKKKIYVALDVPVTQLPLQAKQLLKALYASLPYAYRRQLGFITYAKEPQSRKAVHLTFVEKGSLRPGDRNIEKDYIFDFANGRFMNVEIDSSEQPYLDFAWDSLERQARADDFYSFAEQMLADMGLERQLAAASYHELSVLFQIEEGNEMLYERHKPAVMRGLLDYLKASGSVDEKLRLNDLFLARFDYEFDRVRQGSVPEPYIVDAFMEYYRLDGRYLESKLVSLFILALNGAGQSGEQGAIASIYAAIEGNSALAQAFFAKLMADSRLADRLLMPFLDKQFMAAAGTKSVLELLERWTGMYPGLAGYEAFQALVGEQLAAKLGQERYSLPAVNRTLEHLQRLSADKRSGVSSGGRAGMDQDWDLLAEALELAVYRGLLAKLDIDRLTLEQIKQAAFLGDKDQMRWMNDRLEDMDRQSTARKLIAVYQLIMLPEPTTAIFDELLPAEIERVQKTVRRLLEGRMEELADAERAVLVFVSSKDTDAVDYPGLLGYLQQNSPGPQLMYRFFHWTQDQPLFMRPRGFVPAYAAAIVAYFKQHDRDAFRNRANRKQYFSKAGAILAAVYKQAERELASPLGRLLRGGNRKGMLFMSIAALGVILVGAGIVWSLSDKGDKGGEMAVSPTASPAPTPDLRPDNYVYAVQSEASAGQEAATSLVFLFKDTAACTQFAPISLSVAASGAEAVEYANLAFEPACSSVEATDLAGSGDASATPEATDSADSADFSATSEATGNAGQADSLLSQEATDSSAFAGATDEAAASSWSGRGTNAQSPGAGETSDGTPASDGPGQSGDSEETAQTQASGDSAAQPGSTTNPLASGNEDSSLEPTSTPDAAGGSAIPFDPAYYPSKVTVSLGKLVDLPVGSSITVGEKVYVLSAAPVDAGDN
jgi:hypothetical protein